MSHSEPTSPLCISKEGAEAAARKWVESHQHHLPQAPARFSAQYYDHKLEGRAVEVRWDPSTCCHGTLELLVQDDRSVSIGGRTTSEFRHLRTAQPVG